MLSKNILPQRKKHSILKIIIIINLVIYIFGTLFTNNIYATQTTEQYSEKINNYPGYVELIEQLKAKYPNWSFSFLYTGLDWNEVIKNETVAYHGRSLVSANKSSFWFCTTCGAKAYDNGSWKCASEAAVAYYMDPRNWINEDYIFQFEDLKYNASIQNIDGVKQILAGTWMSGETITYVDTSGATQTIEKSYAQVIMNAAASANISPYHLAARIKQEQGVNKASSTGCGTYTNYVGYYNLLNIDATGVGNASIITKALNYAKTEGWLDPEKSIMAGASFLAKEYIGRGQSTLYLQKFDVDNSDGSLYYHQYMQNIEAAKTEGNSVKSSYQNMGLLNNSMSFVIPVYENMPVEKSAIPGSQTIVTQDVCVNGIDVAVREAKGTSSNIITRVNTGDNLVRIEMATTMQDGYYWDKIVLQDGRKGYIARSFINEIQNTTTLSTPAITNTGVNLRNGPGTNNTSVIITLSKGQAVTVLETGRYNGLDGYDWSRVMLADGTKGYLVSKYVNVVNNGTDEVGNILAVVNDSGVRLRKGVGTSTDIITTLNTGDMVTIVQRNVGTASGFNWDKVVTASGLKGYMANAYLTIQESTTPSATEKPSTPVEPEDTTKPINEKVKIDSNNIICVPDTTVATIKNLDDNAVITRNGIPLTDTDLIGTGCVAQIGKSTYTVVKMGDVSGDGIIDARDSLRILKYSVGSYKLDGEFLKSADLNADNIIDARDSLRILKYSVGTYSIGF